MKVIFKLCTWIVLMAPGKWMISQDCLFLNFPEKNPIKSSGINFSIRKIIDARENPDSMGTYFEQQGALSKTVVYTETFATGLKRYLDANYPKREDQLILVIEHLNVSNTSESPKDINADFRLIYCISVDDSLKKVWQDDLKASYSSKGKPKDMMLVLFTALNESLAKVPAVNWNKIYPDYLLPFRKEEAFPPLFNCDTLSVGVYTTLNAILENRPSNTHLFRVKISNGKKYLMHKESARMVDKRGYVAYSDGQSVFINTRAYRSFWKKYASPHGLKEARGRGRYLVWYDDITDKSEVVAGGLFGVVGSIAATYMNVFVWDTTKGEIFELDRIQLNRILSEYPEVLELYNNTPNHNNTMVWLDMIVKYDEYWLKDHHLKGIPSTE